MCEDPGPGRTPPNALNLPVATTRGFDSRQREGVPATEMDELALEIDRKFQSLGIDLAHGPDQLAIGISTTDPATGDPVHCPLTEEQRQRVLAGEWQGVATELGFDGAIYGGGSVVIRDHHSRVEAEVSLDAAGGASIDHVQKVPRLRPELPPLPQRLRHLPIDARGYPVPFFVAMVDGVPDHRIADGAKKYLCDTHALCWICGMKMDKGDLAFLIGPMCAINRVSSEPPSHVECLEYSARACPFLTRPAMKRGTDTRAVPEGMTEPGGTMLRHNPGVTLLWITKHVRPIEVERGKWLYELQGEPVALRAYAEGRPATRDELRESVESGLPLLYDACHSLRERFEVSKAIEAGRTLLARHQLMEPISV